MITIKVIPNILGPEGRVKEEVPFDITKTLLCYLKSYDLEDQKIIVNGEVVEDLERKLVNGDEIIITPDVEELVTGVIAIIGAIALTAGKIALTALPFVWVGLSLASAGYAIYSAFAGGPRMPSNGLSRTGGMEDGSAVYGWDGIALTSSIGIPIGVVLGKHRVGGNKISQYISTDGDKNYLNMLICLSEGEVEYIDDILINDNPIENFEGVEVYKNYGTEDQAVLPYFDQTHQVSTIGVDLEVGGEGIIYTTGLSNIDAFEVYMVCPNGLSVQEIFSWGAELKEHTVTFSIEYKKHSSSVWTTMTSPEGNDFFYIRANKRSAVRRIYRKEGLDSDRYDIRVKKLSGVDNALASGLLRIQAVDEVRDISLAYEGLALLGFRFLATEQLNNTEPNVTCVVKRKVSQPKVMNGATEVNYDDYYWDPDYDSGNGAYRLFLDDTVLTWDGSTYVSKYSSNPIWVINDLLINNVYGVGDYIDNSIINQSLLINMAKYCDSKTSDGNGGYEKLFKLDAVLDSATRVMDVIAQLSASFRGMAYYSGGAIHLKIDKEEESIQEFKTYGMGNIISDFEQVWTSNKDKINVVEVQFMDENNQYKQDSIIIEDEDELYDYQGNQIAPRRKKEVRLMCTRLSQAVREGKYAIRASKYHNKMISFKAGIDAVISQPGDVIGISHDVPQYGFSGRVVSGTISSVTLDRTVVVEAGKSYKVRVTFNDDTTEEKAVSNSPGSYTVLTLSENFSQAPQNFDNYSFGEIDKVVYPIRVVKIERENTLEVKITGRTYDERIYDDSGLVLPVRNYSSLSMEIPDVEDLVLTESLFMSGDGSISTKVTVWFQKPTTPGDYYIKAYEKARIYLSSDGGLNWKYIGETYGESYIIDDDFIEEETYRVAVVSVGKDGAQNAVGYSPYEDITIVGKTAKPGNVTGFDVQQKGNNLLFSWNAVADIDLSHYKIKRGSDWDSDAVVVVEDVRTTSILLPVTLLGSIRYLIKAVDTSGNESAIASYDVITVELKDTSRFIAELDFFSEFPFYIRSSGIDIYHRADHSRSYVRPVFGLSTQQTWREMEDLGKTWQALIDDGDFVLDSTFEQSGYLEMIREFDIGTLSEFVVDPEIGKVDANSQTFTIQISYSSDNITWTSFANLNTSTIYVGRYIKLKLLWSTSNSDYNIYLYSLLVSFLSPDVIMVYGGDVDIPDTGSTISYGVTFSTSPKVVCTITDGTEGVVIVSNKTTTSFDVIVKNLSGVAIEAEIDWIARGI